MDQTINKQLKLKAIMYIEAFKELPSLVAIGGVEFAEFTLARLIEIEKEQEKVKESE